jgi:flavin-dependent dehydrogenase
VEEARAAPRDAAPGLSGRRYDVVVLGCGPAGAAVALVLARKQLSVAVLCRPRTGPAVGETVPPAIVRPLARLGLWQSFLAAGHAQAPGALIAWGDAQPFENDFVFNAYGPGWHIDRDAFDAMLLSAARDAGAEVHCCLTADCIPVEAAGWVLPLRGGGSFHARWVVDATGRSGWLSRRRGATRRSLDRLISLVKFVPAHCIRETRTLIEACESGWWYAAAVPGNRAVVAYFSDADLLPPDKAARAALWDVLFAQTAIIANFHRGAPGQSLHAFAASSGRVVPCAGSRWIAVGDAVACYDPLSGQGITKALTSAIDAAECIFDRLQSGGTPVNFTQTMDKEYGEYLRFRAAHYRREARWQDAIFWRRRSRVTGMPARR